MVGGFIALGTGPIVYHCKFRQTRLDTPFSERTAPAGIQMAPSTGLGPRHIRLDPVHFWRCPRANRLTRADCRTLHADRRWIAASAYLGTGAGMALAGRRLKAPVNRRLSPFLLGLGAGTAGPSRHMECDARFSPLHSHKLQAISERSRQFEAYKGQMGYLRTTVNFSLTGLTAGRYHGNKSFWIGPGIDRIAMPPDYARPAVFGRTIAAGVLHSPVGTRDTNEPAALNASLVPSGPSRLTVNESPLQAATMPRFQHTGCTRAPPSVQDLRGDWVPPHFAG